MKLLLTAYGNSKGIDKGIVELDYNIQENILRKNFIFPIDGKCNLVGIKNDILVFSRQKEGNNFLDFYSYPKFELIREDVTEHFYSYLQFVDNYLLLASYEDGVDTLYSFEEEKIIKNSIHQRSGYDIKGKSHYIHQLKDGRVVAVDNVLQQIYVYKDLNFEIDHIEEFNNINIRLMSFTDDEQFAFLNTEKSNELLVLDSKTFKQLDAFKLTDNPNSFSGAHTIDDKGRFIFVGNRGENSISVYENDRRNVSFVEKIKCGKIPRDCIYKEGFLFVSCTDENAVEVYKMNDRHLYKVNTIEVFKPIVFEMK